MKGKITTGRGLGGLHRYIFGKTDAEYIAGSCASSDFLRTCAALRAQRPDVRQAAVHISISMPPGQGLTPEQWEQAGRILIDEMGLQGCEFQLVRHRDTDHDHCHMEFCKVKPDGSIWKDSYSARRLHKACERIERELGLRITLTVEQYRAERERAAGKAPKPMSDGALRHFQRTGQPHQKTIEAIQRRIANERKNSDRAAHSKTVLGAGKLAARPSENRSFNPESGSQIGSTRSANRSATGSHRSPGTTTTGTGATTGTTTGTSAARTRGDIEGVDNMNLPFFKKPAPAPAPAPVAAAARPQQPDAIAGMRLPGLPLAGTEPPTLSGRLMPVRTEKGWDLFWQGNGKASFRYQPNENRILSLAPPNEKSVSALFDLAKEKGIGMPQITISGTLEFQMLAATEAAKRGLPVDLSKLDDSARQAYRQTWDRQHGDAANSIAFAAYESADRHEEANRSKPDAPADTDTERDQQRQQMRM